MRSAPTLFSAALFTILASTTACLAQARNYGYGQDHTWAGGSSLADTRAHAGGSGMRALTDPGVTETKTEEPQPPAATGIWKYAYDGRLWLQGTRGFAVWGASLGCYDNATGGATGNTSICGAAPAAVGSCIANGYGVGNCTSGVPFTGPYTQQTYTANTSYFWD